MRNNIDIITTEKDYYYNYIKILLPIVNKICGKLSNNLVYIREGELQVLSSLMYHYSHAPYDTTEDKNRYIFSIEMSYNIMEEKNINMFYYNNILSRLRKYGIIIGKRNKRMLHPIFYVHPLTKEGYTQRLHYVLKEQKQE